MIHKRLKSKPEPEDKELVQGKVPVSLKREVEKSLGASTWSEFLEACMEEFLNEIREKKN